MRPSRVGLHRFRGVADSARDVNAPHRLFPARLDPPALALTRAVVAAMLLALPLLGSGCQSARLAAAYTRADDFKAFVGVAHADPPETADTRYRVAAPDTLHITVLSGGEAVDHRVTLPPDGRLLLPGLAWPVDTTGLTPGEVADDLRRALTAAVADDATINDDAGDDATADGPAAAPGPVANRGLTLDPADVAAAERERLDGADPVYVAVRVDRFASRRVFVFGQVHDPGAQAWDGNNRLSSALAAAQPGHRADLSRVLVLRPGPDGDPQRRLVVATRRLLDTGDNTLDVALAPDDIVFVPATGLGRVGLAVDQVLPSPRADAAWLGARPGPFFPPVRLAAAAPAEAPTLAAETAEPPEQAHASVAEAHAHAEPDTGGDATPAPAADASTPRAVLMAGDLGDPAADPFAGSVANAPNADPAAEDAAPLMQIRFDDAPPTPAPDRAPAADTDAQQAEATVRFWAP